MEFSTINGLKKEINRRIDLAVEDTIQELKEILKNTVNEYFYSQYTPKYYNRTWKLLNSCAYKMLGEGVGSVYLDRTGKYSNGNLLSEVQESAAKGYHGLDTGIQTEGRFWKKFEELIYDEGLDILEKHLISQGFELERNSKYLIESGLDF